MKKMTLARCVALAAVMSFALSGQTQAATPWDLQALGRAPKVYEAQTREPGVRALYFESVPFRGKPTRVFAYYGAPAGKKLPAMVLVHGGGGTAFAEWVRIWNRRGYAALAMDTCGYEPEKANDANRWNPPKKRQAFGGPEGWDASFNTTGDPVADQWTYHAVAAVILAHSLIRSFPEVDPKRVGVTGISWGGYLTCIVSGVDSRFRCAVPVYGCGFLGEDSAWVKDFKDRPGKGGKMAFALGSLGVSPNAKCRCSGSAERPILPIPWDHCGNRTICQKVRAPWRSGCACPTPILMGPCRKRSPPSPTPF